MIPYCLESWPYDISELVVVGAAKDMRTSSGSSSSSWNKAQNIQWDLATGAVGGTVAVLVSMPFDVVSMYRADPLYASQGLSWVKPFMISRMLALPWSV